MEGRRKKETKIVGEVPGGVGSAVRVRVRVRVRVGWLVERTPSRGDEP